MPLVESGARSIARTRLVARADKVVLDMRQTLKNIEFFIEVKHSFGAEFFSARELSQIGKNLHRLNETIKKHKKGRIFSHIFGDIFCLL